MRLVRRFVPALPTLIGAAGLGLCAGLLMFNLTVRGIADRQGIQLGRYRPFAPLIGVSNTVEKQRLTLRSFIDGSFQTAYARLIGSRMPLFTGAVRLRNQVAFSIFNTSAVPTIIVGTGRELVERPYIDDYCSRDVAAFLPEARIWAGHIRTMQDRLEAQGKTFLYVVTPSKVAQYPEFIPPGMHCPSSAADRTGLVPAWFQLLQAAGVHALDLTATISQAHGHFPFLLYPVGGIHWNAVAGALGGQTVAAALGGLRKDGVFGAVDLKWRMKDIPDGVDVDLQNLLNLIWLPPQQPVPGDVLQAAPTGTGCRAEDIVIIGGSFGHALGESLSEQSCRPMVREYEYWHVFRIEWRDGDFTLGPVDPVERAASLRQASVVIYEDNEQMLRRSQHGKAFYDDLVAGAH